KNHACRSARGGWWKTAIYPPGPIRGLASVRPEHSKPTTLIAEMFPGDPVSRDLPCPLAARRPMETFLSASSRRYRPSENRATPLHEGIMTRVMIGPNALAGFVYCR